MLRVLVLPGADRGQSVRQLGTGRAGIEKRNVEDAELALLVVQVELEAADAAIQLHVERRVRVVPLGGLAPQALGRALSVFSGGRT